MIPQSDLLTAIRSGRLDAVRAALNSGQTLDGEGQPGLAMGMACFFGHVPIVRELVMRGAQVNLPDNRAPTSPLTMAVRGNKVEVVRALIELGAEVPDGMKVGLTPQEISVAQWIAFRDGKAKPRADMPQPDGPVVEEIQFKGLRHVDTQILEADMLREALGKE